jgi:hypothetical protein
MEIIGKNIEKMQLLINTPMVPPPRWARKWQTEAEHVLFLSQKALEDNDLAKLRELDAEASRLVEDRQNMLDRTST